jgi:hypothetical protein
VQHMVGMRMSMLFLMHDREAALSVDGCHVRRLIMTTYQLHINTRVHNRDCCSCPMHTTLL